MTKLLYKMLPNTKMKIYEWVTDYEKSFSSSLETWSFHMKFINRAFGNFNKFHMK